ncbi:putative polyketide synthase [Lentinula raphanica]|uniref:Polyketide synthase n=1 Tax=Lentinula raphanica TaxID=153919 RepID=A0AA38PBP6_9AGAR|nr:putative polyketide synthase [Lentinula raphanica]KAJ3973676.1 putative polyketide synthase [Lentinula raphanica]
MSPSTRPQLLVPIFAGQGSTQTTISSYIDSIVRRSQHGLCATLLTVCHEAFLDELDSLSPLELAQIGVDPHDFRSPETLLTMWLSRFPHNAVMSSSTLILMQLLQYLSFVEHLGAENGSLRPFADLIGGQSMSQVGILGFSSGILSACAVASSDSVKSFLSYALEAYRLAFWIGTRCQLYRFATSYADSNLPWSVVFLGISAEVAQEAISNFNTQLGNDLETEDPSHLYITAIMDDCCVTVSGPPPVLADFTGSVCRTSPSVVVHQTTVDTLYHSPVHLRKARDQILSDVVDRNIRFPELHDLRVPVRSTSDAALLDPSVPLDCSLVQRVIDMLIIEPVRWDLVTEQVSQCLPATDVLLLNFGPGLGVARTIEKSCRSANVQLRDVCGETQDQSVEKPTQEPIAIVGMAVNMPGAVNVGKLWEVIQNGINTISEIPGHRFSIENYEGTNRQMKARTGNFIEGADEFDNRFFKISPREAKSMDPQQRILLHTAYEALEDSGYVPGTTLSFEPSTFGCYIGASTNDYVQNLRGDIDVYYSTGTLSSYLSGRISYAMGWSGPSMVVDTACSSSLSAIYQGARALMNGDCRSALVGGVNVITSPDMFVGLDRGHFLSPTGQSKAFDAAADGYSRGEGCGLFVLKRLSDAIAENDNIYGVIRGIELNQSGLAHSITHPHTPTQVALFERVLRNAAIHPSQVNVVEAHGTGTQAGDVNELASIRQVFATGRTPQNPLYVTSVKGNIGHLEAASGAAGLAKLLLMFKHRTIPSQASFVTLNHSVEPLENDNTVIPRRATVWKPSHPGSCKAAFLNNFGAAGSNAALVLEEYAQRSSEPFGHALVFLVSAKDEHALEKLRLKYVDWLQSKESECVPLADIAYSMTARRQLYPYRLTVVASERTQLIDDLRKAPVVASSTQPARRVVFVFSGQSSQYLGMGRTLYDTSPLFKYHIDECHAILVALGFPGILPIILENEGILSDSEQIEAYQAAIFSLEYALGKLWMFWGLVPTALIGHSLGEYTALVFAGVLSLRDALTLVAHRVRLMLQTCELGSTGMLAVNLHPGLVKHLLGTSDNHDLAISCYNGPNDCVVSGPVEALARFKFFLDITKRCRSKMLAVPYGYHSVVMSSCAKALTPIAERIEIRAPNLPIASNVDGSVVRPGDAGFFNPDYFAKHCSHPVQFDDGVRTLNDAYGLSDDVWLEIGPHPTCLPMLKTHNSFTPNAILVSSLKRDHDSWMTLGSTLCTLAAADVSLQRRNIFSHLPHSRCISLPSYPFATSKYWVPYEEASALTLKSRQTSPGLGFTLLHRWTQYPCSDNGYVATFETPISHLSDLILGHRVGGLPLCPASVFIEIILSSVELSVRHRDQFAKESLVQIISTHFVKGLVYKEDVPRTIVTRIALEDGRGCYSISSRVDSESSKELVMHVRGEYLLKPIPDCTAEFCQILPSLAESISYIKNPSVKAEVFLARTTYEVVFPSVVHYAEEYHTMQSLLVVPNDFQGWASIRLPSSHYSGSFTAHPVLLDTLLQLPGFIANLQGKRQSFDGSGSNSSFNAGDVFICSEIGSFSVLAAALDDNATYSVHCEGVWLDNRTLSFNVSALKGGDSSEVVATLKGVVFRQMVLDSLRKALSLAATTGQVQVSNPLPVLNQPPIHSRARSHSSPPNFVNVVGELRSRVLDAIAETCGVPREQVTIDTALDSLGIDSLMLIELSGKLQFLSSKIHLELQTLYSCRTVADIVRKCSSVLGLGNPPPLTIVAPSTTCAESEPSSPTSTLVTEDGLLEGVAPRAEGYFDVKKIISTALSISETFEDDTDLETLGLDSLASIEVLHALQIHFGRQLPNDFFRQCRTVAAIQAHFRPGPIQRRSFVLQSPPKEAVQARLIGTLRLGTNPVRVQTDNRMNTPIFFIHDGSGLVNYYDKVESLHRDVWAIYNPKFLLALPWNSIKDMATSYADHISALSPKTILLGGWSFGGVVAYEVALQLAKRGINTKGIILIDAPNPIGHVPLSDTLIKTIAKYDRKTGPVEIGKLVQKQFAMNAQLLSAYDPHETKGVCPPIGFLRSESGYAVEGVTDIPMWLADRSDSTNVVTGWSTLSSSVKVWDIPGHHFQAFDNANIALVSAKLIQTCEYLDSL